MSESAEDMRRLAWRIVLLLLPVAMLNYMDRQMLAAMKVSVVAEVSGISSEAAWGKVLAAFKWTYAVCSLLGGYAADRWNRRYLIAGSLLVWSAVTWATGHVQTYPQLLATRAVMGVSEALYIPAALALIADFHQGSTRSRAVGLHQTGIYLGVILGGFSGYAADHPDFGWRWMFDMCGLLGIAYAVPLFFFLREPARRRDVAGTAPLKAAGELAGNPSYWLLVVYFALPSLSGWVVRDWMPTILQREFGISQGKAGVSATLYLQVAMVLGALLGGYLADRWMRKSERGRIRVSALGMALVVPAIFGVGYSPQLGHLAFAIFFLIWFGLAWGFFDTNHMPILCQIVRPELRATGYGLMNFVGVSCGGFADFAFGWLNDRGVGLLAIFSTFAGVALLASLLVLMIRPAFGGPGGEGMTGSDLKS